MKNITMKKQEVVKGIDSKDIRRGLRFKFLIMLTATLFLFGSVQGVFLTKYVVDLFQQGSDNIIKTSEKELLNIALEEIALHNELLRNTANHFTSHQRKNIMDFPFELYQENDELLKQTIIEKVEETRKQHLYTTQILVEMLKQQAETKVKTRIQLLKQQQSKDIDILQSSLDLSFFFFLFSLVVLLGVLQSTWIMKTVIKPILALVEGSRLIEQGHLEHQIKVTGNDEIGMLAMSFNNMTGTLLNSRNTLVSAKDYTADIISSMLDSLIIISPDYHIKTVNTAACTLLGYEEKELVGQPIHMILEKEKENFWNIGLAKLVRKSAIREMDVSYLAKDGSIIPVLLSGTAMWDKDRELQAIMLAAKDMRESRMLLELLDTTSHLEQEIAERKNVEENLRKSRQEAEVANRAKSEFVANMSHEIRTPMNTIIGMTDLLLQEAVSPDVKKHLSIVKSSSRILLGVINDILDFSRIESGKLSIEARQFSLHAILANIWDIFNKQAIDKGIEFHLQTENELVDNLVGDPLRLEQVLVNLLVNGIKFTDKGKVVLKIKSKATSDQQTRITFSVCDSGIGITAEKAEKIFKPFTQADSSTSRHFGGTGLGLTICKQLVDLMEGEISLSSIPGEGSTFSFSVPCEIQTLEPQSLVREYIGKRILVVNDKATTLTMMKKSLNGAGFDVETLSLPGKILEKLSKHNKQGIPFDLVIMDNMIKEKGNIGDVKMLCNEPLLAGSPVIILTDFFSNDFSKQLAMAAGVNSILFKPVGTGLLLETIRTLLKFDTDDGIVAVEASGNDFHELQGLTVLLAEDNSFNQILAEEVLGSVGVTVRIANNGREAVEMLDKDIDAILMDIQMPEMDGFEATGIIRSQQEFAAVPIIAMTAHAMSGYKQKCIQAGMDDYVAKPFQPKDVFAVLARNITSSTKTEDPVDSLTVEPDAVRRHLRDFYKINGEQLEKMLQSTQRALAKDLAAAEKSLAHGDLESLSRAAHGLKGLLLNLGYSRLATLAKRIEKLQVRADDEKEAALQQQLAVLKNGLSAFVGVREE